MIQKDIDALEIEKIDESNETDNHRKYNILDILINVSSIFTGLYFHYENVPEETMFERSIWERIKLRRGRSDEIERKEKNINNELIKVYFIKYQIPSSMCKKLSEKKDAVNDFWVDSIKKLLSKLQRIIDYTNKDDVAKIKEIEKIIDIVEKILEFHKKIQSGQGLKMLAPNQMLSRLLISLAQLNAVNNSEKLKNKIRQLLYSLYRSKQLTKNISKSLVDII